MSLFSKKKQKNRYSESLSVSQSRKLKTVNKQKEVRKAKLNKGSLLGFISAATVVTVCVMFFVTVAVSLIFLYRWSTSSDYFALQEIDVHGLNNLSYIEVLNQAEIQNGMNSLALSLDALEARVSQHPWVKSASVKRALPDGIVIKIKEKEPSYWTLKDGHMHYTDRNGNIIAAVDSNKFLALPILEIAPDSKHITKYLESNISKISQVLALLPKDFRNPALYRMTQAKGVEVHFEGKPLRLLFGFEDIDGNIKRMNLVINDLKNRGELTGAKEIRAHNNKVWVMMGNG